LIFGDQVFSMIMAGLSNIYKRTGSTRSFTFDCYVTTRICASTSWWCSKYPNKLKKMITIFSDGAVRSHFLFQWPTDCYISRFLPNDLERTHFARLR